MSSRVSLSVGDDGEKMGGWAGRLQDVQVPPDVQSDLLQLHDPRPRPGEAQSRHQTSRRGQLALQESRF